MAASYILLCLLLHFALPSCYILPTHKDFINNNKKDWSEAESHCLSTYSSHLLSIHDSHSFQNLRNKIIAIGQEVNHFWIGLINRNPSTINYTWTDHSAFDFGGRVDGTFPWFDERPESPSTDQYVRLWGGSASLLWDDTHYTNEYFWICNDAPYEDDDTDTKHSSNEPPSDSMEATLDTAPAANTTASSSAEAADTQTSIAITGSTKEPDTNSDEFMVPIGHEEDGASHLNTFWKFALFGILILTTCIILMRLRIMYRAYARKRRASSIGIGPRQITDLSVIESGTSYNKRKHKSKHDAAAAHALSFASIDQREDSLELCNEMAVISPFSDQTGSSDDIPQVPMVSVNELQISYKQTVSLEIEYDVTSHNSVEGQPPSQPHHHVRQPGMVLPVDSMVADSMAATFDANTMDLDMEEQRRSILLIMEQTDETDSYEEETSSCHSKENAKCSANRSSFDSIHSTMAAFDAQSFRMKGDRDEFKFDGSAHGEYDDGLMGNSAHSHASASASARRLRRGGIISVGQLQYVVSGETSDDCSETQIEKEDEEDAVSDVSDVPKKREKKMSGKEMEIKANISQIMENLKRMKDLANE